MCPSAWLKPSPALAGEGWVGAKLQIAEPPATPAIDRLAGRLARERIVRPHPSLPPHAGEGAKHAPPYVFFAGKNPNSAIPMAPPTIAASAMLNAGQ